MTSTQSSGGQYSGGQYPGGQYPGGQGGPAWGPPSPPFGYPPPPPNRPRRSALRVVGIIASVVVGVPVLLFVVAIVVMLVRGPSAAPATGPGPVGPGPVTLLQLKTGDCFNSPPIPADGSTVGVDDVLPVPCSSPHTRQVVNTLAYPGLTWEGGAEAQSGEQCTSSFRADLRDDVRSDDRYLPARMHGVVGSSGTNSVYVACVIATEAPTTGSALR